MSELVPTPEQQLIIDAAKNTKDNILIEALAGAAKTSTLEMIAKAIKGIPIMSLAFNKRIAEEMQRRLPSHVKCATLNAIGHRAWSQSLSKPITLNTDKMYDLLKEETDDLAGEDKWLMREMFAETLQALKKSKALGFIPPKLYANIKHLHPDQDLFYEGLESDLGILLAPLQIHIINSCLERSIKQAYDGLIDFDDQIYMPTLFHGVFPRFPLTLCDEVQDFSVLNQKMVAKMVEDRRIIAVGDPFQSIYAFRGADSNAMQAMETQFHMKKMSLSISFRCPKAGVELARRRAPHMQHPEWAREGQIETKAEWRIADIPDYAYVICRNNAPLFWLALQFLKKGRGVTLLGSQLSKGLVRILKKLGPERMPLEEVKAAVEQWQTQQLKKAKTEAKQEIIREKVECLYVFINAGKFLNEMVAYAEAVFSAKGNVQLMTGHKAKGLEAEHVFHLNAHLVNPDWIQDRGHLVEQELNLQYVIDTRFKDTYTYLDTEGLRP